MEKEFSPHLKVILREMCRRVKFPLWRKIQLRMDHGWEYFSEDTWFCEYTWSRDEQNSFIDWMANYLDVNNKARMDLTFCMKRKKCCKKAAEEFVWNYGWKECESYQSIKETVI